MGGEAVYLWLTKAKAPLDTGQKRDQTSEYLGRCGDLHVYVALGPKAPEAWPKAVADLSRVLGIAKE